jgi:hypothetical protein
VDQGTGWRNQILIEAAPTVLRQMKSRLSYLVTRHGQGWQEIGAPLNVTAKAGQSLAEAAFSYAASANPYSWHRFDPRYVSWTRSAWRCVVHDCGPYESHLADYERDHGDGCAPGRRRRGLAGSAGRLGGWTVMGGAYTENDGRYPNGSPVLVRYPSGREGPVRTPAGELTDVTGPGGSLRGRREWPWLPGRILGQCGPEEWHIAVEARDLAELENGSPAPDGTPDDDLVFPDCFRDSSEIRQATP